MRFTRRDIVAGLGALPLGACSIGVRPRAALVSAAKTAGDQYVAVRISDRDEIDYVVPLPERGHDALVSPDGQVLTVVARRPGRTIAQFRWSDGKLLGVMEAAKNRHFYGHAIYGPGGRTLLTSENDLETGDGVITVRDGTTLEPITTFPSFGIGPHEMVWHPDNGNLVVANGGIATHPDYGRVPLNVGAMTPSLVQIDVRRGILIDKRTPRFNESSVRHIDILNDGTTLVGLQQQEGLAEDAALVVSANWSTGEARELEALTANSADLRALESYTASVCCEPRSGISVVTAPRGHRVTFWNARKGTHLKTVRISDAAGVTFDANSHEFVISSGRGILRRYAADTLIENTERRKRFDDLRFDNHITIASI
ncbi:MAG: DUF1513 domain-containing protein [Pseudomonadota bacterium]